MATANTFKTTQIKACSNQKLNERFCDLICGTEDASSKASGDLTPSPLEFVNRVFPNFIEASAWLDENTNVQGPMVAVIIGTTSHIPTAKIDAKIDSVTKRLTSIQSELGYGWASKDSPSPIADQVINRVRSGINKFKACPGCNSKISVAHIKQSNCPVCGKDRYLFTESDLKRVISLELKMNELIEKHSLLDKQKQTSLIRYLKVNDDQWYWLVGGWIQD